MLAKEPFKKAREFIYRHGDLFTRRRFAYHFEDGDKQTVLDALACYQNKDGGFGNGLEPDILCPESSGICTEVALGYLAELGVDEGPVFDRGLQWILSAKTENGDLPHPVEAVRKYPHGPWWEKDEGRILSIAGLLGKMGRADPDVSSRAAAVFEKSYVPFPKDLGVYSYPVALYLHYGDLDGRHRDSIAELDAAFPGMLQKEAWHHPLFFCQDRWDHESIPSSLWHSEAERAIATIQEDGGIRIEQYAQLPWWRPIWTLDLLVTLKRKNLLGETG